MKYATLLLVAICWHGLAKSYDNFNTDSNQLEQINVDGQFSRQAQPQAAPRQLSNAERIRVQRAQLEREHERMIQEKIEEVRYQNEVELMRQMQRTMDRTMDALGQL